MNEVEFMFWLKGVLDSVGNGVMTNEQVNIIRSKINEVTAKKPLMIQDVKWDQSEWNKTGQNPVLPFKTTVTC